jgi:hypothetical protein
MGAALAAVATVGTGAYIEGAAAEEVGAVGGELAEYGVADGEVGVELDPEPEAGAIHPWSPGVTASP